ncbi:MAG: hypothetical protein IIU46_08100 [Treponema sp.]|nr:hypothetical protein [Treponema sp.]
MKFDIIGILKNFGFLLCPVLYGFRTAFIIAQRRSNFKKTAEPVSVMKRGSLFFQWEYEKALVEEFDRHNYFSPSASGGVFFSASAVQGNEQCHTLP